MTVKPLCATTSHLACSRLQDSQASGIEKAQKQKQKTRGNCALHFRVFPTI